MGSDSHLLLKQLLAAVRENTDEVKQLREAFQVTIDPFKYERAMTVEVAAEYLRMGQDAVYDLVNLGKLAAVRYSIHSRGDRSQIRITKEDADAFLRAHRVPSLYEAVESLDL